MIVLPSGAGGAQYTPPPEPLDVNICVAVPGEPFIKILPLVLKEKLSEETAVEFI